MKKKNFILQVALFAIISFSISNCSKKPSVEDDVTKPAATFKFVVNGTTYHWNGNWTDNFEQGSQISKYVYNGITYHALSAYPLNAGIYLGISLKLNTATLSTTTYTLAATSRVAWENADHHCGVDYRLLCASSEVGDFATITITKIHDGYIDGTFTAGLTKVDAVNLVKVNITEGEFHNVKIVE